MDDKDVSRLQLWPGHGQQTSCVCPLGRLEILPSPLHLKYVPCPRPRTVLSSKQCSIRSVTRIISWSYPHTVHSRRKPYLLTAKGAQKSVRPNYALKFLEKYYLKYIISVLFWLYTVCIIPISLLSLIHMK